jgi:hypothetical protein
VKYFSVARLERVFSAKQLLDRARREARHKMNCC